MGCGCNNKPNRQSAGSAIVRTLTAQSARRPVPPIVVIPPITPPPPPECPNNPPIVNIYPPSGSEVQFPCIVLLSTNLPDVTIYYTIDGTEPTKGSTPFTVGIVIPNANYTINARAFPNDNCPAGPIASASYVDPSLENFSFAFLCTDPAEDHVGRFPELDPPGFAPNSNDNDYQFQLLFDMAVNTEISRIEIYQTDQFGNWGSGQVWATDGYIHPYVNNPETSFHCYPLVIKEEPGAVQLFSDYQVGLGEYAAGSYEWRLWAQAEVALTTTSYFMLKMFLADGRVIVRIINAVCVPPPPPPCTKPDAPTCAATCAPQITVSGTTPSINQVYNIYRRSTICGSPAWSSIKTDVSDGAGAFSFVDTDVEKCCSYEYYVEIFCDAYNGYKASEPSAVTTVPCEGILSITSDKEETCAGDDVVLAWMSENCDSVSIDNGIGIVDADGTITVNPLVTTTYTITCNNAACGNLTANVTITVNALGTNGCGCWNASAGVLITVPATISLFYRSDYNTVGTNVTLYLQGPTTDRIENIRYTANFPDNISVSPGICEDGDTHTWVASIRNSQIAVYQGYLDNSTDPRGSYTRFFNGQGNYRDVVVS